jgi:alkylated DNA nucleotide flippase Atl1
LEKFFGYSGKMLKPSLATIEAQLRQIPAGKLITIDLLRQKLAREYQVQVTCPFDTKLALRALSNTSGQDAPYWRVVRKNGALIPYFPGGLDGHSARLRQEGFTIDTLGKTPKVKMAGNLIY